MLPAGVGREARHDLLVDRGGSQERGTYANVWVLLTSDTDFARARASARLLTEWPADLPRVRRTDDSSSLWALIAPRAEPAPTGVARGAPNR